MLTTRLIHPEILAALAGAGHGSQVLIADGNYPFTTGSNPAARRVYLNLTRGFAPVDEVLAVLAASVPIEAAHVMVPDDGPEPAIFASFRDVLPEGVGLQPLGRFEFYDAARGSDVALVLATGEQRIYANILLTIGVVPPDA
ncbi:MAG TPA: RbsD or FucU transport [Candidatus Hydrogenedentes bacterium]|nr:RbsD or FucU transport [Candidatus Hydrogenedentota bacterium]